MDKIEKEIKKLTQKEQGIVKEILEALSIREIAHLNIKKLKGRDDVFRVRKERIRIIYRRSNTGKIFLLTIDRRSEDTYKF